MQDIIKQLASHRPRILVVGDLMLDRYTWGDATRVSPEAPVVVLKADRHDVRCGGSANVATALCELGADVSIAGVIGDDGNGRTLRAILAETAVHEELMLVDPSRPTTTKQRIIGRAEHRHAHQILRVDEEIHTPIDVRLQQRLLAAISLHLGNLDAIVISDYGKGVCTPAVLRHVIDTAGRAGLPVIVDPQRHPDFSHYANATVIKPNRIEAQAGTGIVIRCPQDAVQAARQICSQFRVDRAYVTLDRDGIAVADQCEGVACVAPTSVRDVYDITGAGDVVCAVLACCAVARVPVLQAAEIANAAGAVAVAEFGACAPSWSAIDGALRPGDKTCSLDELVKYVEAYRRNNKTIVFTNGCFDLLHVGHVTLLQQAAALGDVLIVAVNSDQSVRRLKGAERPVIGQHDRAAMLAALACVDHVVVFDDATPLRLLQRIRPDVLTKGGTTTTVVGREFVEQYGGSVIVLETTDGMSTSSLLTRIRSS